MADNVVFKIELVDDSNSGGGNRGSTAAPSASLPSASPPPPSLASLTANARPMTSSLMATQQTVTDQPTKVNTAMGATSPGGMPEVTNFITAVGAGENYSELLQSHIQKLRERQEKAKLTEQLDADAQKLAPELFPDLKPLTIDEEANHYLEAVQAQIEKNKRAESILAKAKRLQPELFKVPEFDPEAEARKRIEAEHRAMRVKAAYLNLKEGPGEALPAQQAPPSLLQSISQLTGQLGFGKVSSVLGQAGNLVPQLARIPAGSATASASMAAEGVAGAKSAGVGAAGAEEMVGAEAAGAGMAGAGMAGLAAAAGPIGLALVAKQLIDAGIDKATQSTIRNIETLGKVTSSLAGNDHIGALTTTMDAAAEGMENFGIAGKVLGSELKIASAGVRTFNTVVQSFIERGKELSMYSGALAGASATAQVRTIMSDIREAREIGDSIARLTDLESQASQELREILLPIKKAIAEDLAAIMEIVVAELKLIHNALEKNKETIRSAARARDNALFALGGPIGMIWYGINRLPERMAAEQKKEQDKDNAKSIMEQQLDILFGNIPGLNDDRMARQQDELRQAANMGMNMPTLTL